MQILVCLLLSSVAAIAQTGKPSRWSEAKANAWYAKQPWLVGSNYTPATAINELEMWQADTFDPAHRQGARVGGKPRHDDDARVPARSAVAAGRRGVTASGSIGSSTSPPSITSGRFRAVRLVLGSAAEAGASSTRRSPACTIPAGCRAPARRRCRIRAVPAAEAYVTGVVGAFAKDTRVLGWDVWNEPDNSNGEQLRKDGAEEQGASSCWRCCRRCSRGRARRAPSSR